MFKDACVYWEGGWNHGCGCVSSVVHVYPRGVVIFPIADTKRSFSPASAPRLASVMGVATDAIWFCRFLDDWKRKAAAAA